MKEIVSVAPDRTDIIDTSIEIEVGRHTLVTICAKDRCRLRIDFNRNLLEVAGDTTFSYTKRLMHAITQDLCLLAKTIESDAQLREVNIIYGIASIPKSIGERLGFHSKEFTNRQSLVSKYKEKTAKKQLIGNTDINKPLRTFVIHREEFLKRYLPHFSDEVS